MACVFFWSLYRPASLPAPFVALCGLLLDLAGLSPLGLWAALLLLLQSATMAARRRLVAARFLVAWAAFTGWRRAAASLDWAAQSPLGLMLLPLWFRWYDIAARRGALSGSGGRLLIRAHRGPAAVELA